MTRPIWTVPTPDARDGRRRPSALERDHHAGVRLALPALDRPDGDVEIRRDLGDARITPVGDPDTMALNSGGNLLGMASILPGDSVPQ